MQTPLLDDSDDVDFGHREAGMEMSQGAVHKRVGFQLGGGDGGRRASSVDGVDDGSSDAGDVDETEIMARYRFKRAQYVTFTTASTEVENVESMMRRINLEMVACGALGSLFIVVHNQVCFDVDTLYFREKGTSCTAGLILEGLSWVVSIVLVWRLIVYYQFQSQRKKLKWGFSSKWKAFVSSSLRWRFAAELVLCSVQPVPFVQGSVWGFGHKVILVTMIMRTYLIIRMLRDFSPVYRRRKQLNSDMDINTDHDIGIPTILKSYFYTHSIAMTAAVVVFLVVLLSYAVYIVERGQWYPHPCSSDGVFKARKDYVPPGYSKTPFSSYWNCVYFTIVTATSLGFGDLTPQTVQGKLLACVTVLCGISVQALLVGVAANRLKPTPVQRKIIYWVRSAKTQERVNALEEAIDNNVAEIDAGVGDARALQLRRENRKLQARLDRYLKLREDMNESNSA